MARQTAGGSGRPRKFDEAVAVHQAMQVFWRHGFDGATAESLSAATGLGISSLYNAFGSKRGLYLAALDTYNQLLGDRLMPLTRGKEGLAEIDKFLRQLWQSKTGSQALPGCLMANAMGEGMALAPDVATRTEIYETNIHAAFRSALTRAVAHGEIKGDAVDPMAGVLSSSLIGSLVSSRNKGGTLDETLTGSLMLALRQWSDARGI